MEKSITVKPEIKLENYFEILMYYYRVKKMPFGEAAKLAQKEIKDNKK